MKKNIYLHLSVLVGIFLPLPFGNVILPYIYWKSEKNKADEEFSIQACNLLNFQLTFSLICYICTTILWYIFIKNLQIGTTPKYSLLIYPLLAAFCVFFIYPIVISFHVRIGKIRKKYYPEVICFFKYKY